MKRSGIRESIILVAAANLDSATLHPGYKLKCLYEKKLVSRIQNSPHKWNAVIPAKAGI
jgi:hypothetical protein